MVRREATNSPLPQGVDERISYWFTTAPWGGTPTNASVKVYDVGGGYGEKVDVTTAVLPDHAATIEGDVITLGLLRNLVLGTRYRVEVQFSIDGNLEETWFIVQAEE